MQILPYIVLRAGGAIPIIFTLMSAEGSRYNRGGFIELGEYPRWFSGEMNADPLTIER
jgi:hypothetical protein